MVSVAQLWHSSCLKSAPSRPTTIRGRHWHIACAVPQAACQALLRHKVGSGLGFTLALCTVSRRRHRKAPQTVHQRYQQLSSRLYRCAVVPFVLLVPESRAQIARGAKQTARLNEHSRIARKPSSGELGRGRDPRGGVPTAEDAPAHQPSKLRR